MSTTQEEAEWQIAEYLIKHSSGLKEKYKDYVQEQLESGIGEVGIGREQFDARTRRLAIGLLQKELMDQLVDVSPEWVLSLVDEEYVTNLLGEEYFDYYK